jgi:hypothetical protein
MLSRMEQGLYAAVRGLHLCLVTLQVPVALSFLLGRHSGSFWASVLGWLAAVIIVLFLLPLDQARYPLGIPAALGRTLPLVLNLGMAMFVERNFKFAAFFGTTSLMAGLLLLLGYGVVRELWTKPVGGAINPAAWILVALALLMAVAVVGTGRDLLTSLQGAPLAVKCGSLVTWIVGAVTTAQDWFGQTVWGSPDPDDARVIAFNASWAGTTAFAFFAAFLLVTGVVFWHAVSNRP